MPDYLGSRVSGRDLNEYSELEMTCDGGYACCALVHVEGCFTGEGDPDAAKGRYVAYLRDLTRQAIEALRDRHDDDELLAETAEEIKRLHLRMDRLQRSDDAGRLLRGLFRRWWRS